MKLSDIQTRALGVICKNKILYYSSHVNRASQGSQWVTKNLKERVTDSTMRKLRKMGLVEFTKGEKVMLASPTEEGLKIG